MKKYLALILAMLLVVTSLVACAPANNTDTDNSGDVTNESKTDNEEDKSGEIVTIKYCAPGAKPLDYDKVMAEVNKKMGEDIGVNVEVEYIPWDAWDQKTNLKLTTGEEFDLLQIMQTHPKLIANNALTDITEILEKVAPNYKKAVPQSVIDAAKVNGKLFVLPTYWYEPTVESKFIIRADLRDKYNFENPKTPYELLDQLEVVMKDWEGNFKPYIPLDAKNISPTGGTRAGVLQVSYDEYPFIIKDQLAIMYEDNSMECFLTSDVFKRDAAFFAEAYKRGLISPDILTIQPSQKNAHVNSGEWYVNFGGIANPATANLPDDAFEMISFAKEGQATMRPMTVKDTVGIPYTSKHPEEAVKFVDWLYTSQENYDLFMYGIEGTHYTSVGERQLEQIINPETNEPSYSFADWMIGNINYIKYDPKTNQSDMTSYRYNEDKNALVHPADAFNFDATNVQAELANVNTAIQTYIIPVYVGVVPYEEGFADALEKVKAAGLDTVMAEYEKQYNEFIKNLG